MRTRESLAQRETDSPTPRRGNMTGSRTSLIAIVLLAGAIGLVQAHAQDGDDAFLPSPVRTVSTMPANGDQNPYGVAFVPSNFPTGSGPLKHGDILVSNFNNGRTSRARERRSSAFLPEGRQRYSSRGMLAWGFQQR